MTEIGGGHALQCHLALSRNRPELGRRRGAGRRAIDDDRGRAGAQRRDHDGDLRHSDRRRGARARRPTVDPGLTVSRVGAPSAICELSVTLPAWDPTTKSRRWCLPRHWNSSRRSTAPNAANAARPHRDAHGRPTSSADGVRAADNRSALSCSAQAGRSGYARPVSHSRNAPRPQSACDAIAPKRNERAEWRLTAHSPPADRDLCTRST